MKCSECKEEVDEIKRVRVAGKTRSVCEDCGDKLEADAAIAEESESAVQSMMGFKGRR